MRDFEYESPEITFLGSIADLTRGQGSLDTDGCSGSFGNQSDSDTGGGGDNQGGDCNNAN